MKQYWLVVPHESLKFVQCFQLDGKQLNQSINADEAVAYGATVQAAMMSNVDLSDKLPRFILNDVTPLSLGTVVVGDVMSTIVKRNTTIPTTQSATYFTARDNQVSVNIDVYEGERSMITDNHRLGEFKLHGLPRLPRGKVFAEVTFDIDANGTLHVSAVEKSTGKKNKITITNDAGRLSKDDIERMIAVAEFYKSEDEIREKRATAKYELEEYVYDIKRKIHSKEMIGQITFTVMKELDDAIAKALQFSDKNPTAEGQESYGSPVP